MKKADLYLFIIIVSLCLSNIFAGTNPTRIILNVTENPATSMAVTWRTDDKVDEAEVQYAVPTNWKDFTGNVQTVKALSDTFTADKKQLVYHHSAIINNLKPATVYVYRVGAGKEWSEWNQFTTAKQTADPFEFVYFGDPQNDIYEHCSRIFRQAYKTAPQAAFWLFAGDITTRPKDNLWGELFDAAGFIFRMTPSIMAAGNHDYLSNDHTKFFIDKTVNPIFRAHLTQPQNGLPMPELAETSYYIDYQGARLVVIDSNSDQEQQAKWLEKLLENNPNPWSIVAFHHPIYSTGSDRDNTEMRKLFLPVFDKYHVDLVLQGHDHTYGRTFNLKNNKISSGKGTTYVVSVSGPKMYELNPSFTNLMAKVAKETQLFQVISIDQNVLAYKCYTVTGELFDSFELIK